LVAIALAFVHRRSQTADTPLPEAPQSGGTDMINMAHIKVAGVGGLGFVMIALWIGIVTPGVRGPLLIGAVSGVILAVALILWRRRTGPMTSSGQRPGANTTLSIEPPEPSARQADDDRADARQLQVAAT